MRKRLLVLTLLAMAAMFFVSGCGSDSNSAPTSTQNTPQTVKTNPGISKAEFEQLKSGMTYEQATAIIGGPGEVISESGNKGEALHTVMYQYKGEKGLGANANLMFQGNKLQNKAQFGLE